MRRFQQVLDKDLKRTYTINILSVLNDWFQDEQAIKSYGEKSRDSLYFISTMNKEIEGFISLHLHNNMSAEIMSMGVIKEAHGQGIGSRLMELAQTQLKKQGFKFLQVKTLGPSVECSFYKSTRKFYETSGFVALEETTALWGEDNPCLIMIKNL